MDDHHVGRLAPEALLFLVRLYQKLDEFALLERRQHGALLCDLGRVNQPPLESGVFQTRKLP
jgi:hypothetical protein